MDEELSGEGMKEKKYYIFLDIDGVMNNDKTYMGRKW